MAWALKSGVEWTSGTHELSGNTYSGYTRTPNSRPLVWFEKPKVIPSKPKPPKKKKEPRAKGASAWD